MTEEKKHTEVEVFKKRASEILNNFCKEWQHSFYNDKIYFDEYQLDFPSAGVYTWKVIAVNVSTLKKMAIVVTGNLGKADSLQHVYTISVAVDGDRVRDFKKNDFNPLELRDKFHTFYTSILNYKEVDKHAYGLYLVFDEDAKILSARTTFTIYKNDEACRADHFVYHVSDLDVLSGYNLVHTGVINYRNFTFLWDHTNIRTVMNEVVFFNAYTLYSDNIERYHSLLQMERI